MSDLKTLYRHSSQYLTGRVAGMVIGFFSFPIFTRVFSVAEYGTLSLVLKIVGLMTVFAKMGLQQSIQRFYEENVASADSQALPRFFSSLFWGAMATAAAVSLLLAAGVAIVPESMVSHELKVVLLIGAILVFVRGMQSIVMGFLRVESWTKLFNALDVAIKGVSVALICLILFTWDRSVHGFLVGTGIVEAAGVALPAVMFMRRGLLRPGACDSQAFRGALSFGFPLIGYELATMILSSGDRILVQHYLGAEAVGYYSAAYNMASYIGESLMVPINLALFPLYMKIWVSDGKVATQEFLSNATGNFLVLAIWVVSVVSITSRDAIVFLGSAKLAAAGALLPILTVGLVVYALHIFLTAGLLIYKQTAVLAKLIAVSAALNMALNVALLPTVGLKGAAFASVVGYGVFIAGAARASYKLLPLHIDLRRCLLCAIAGGLSAFGAAQFVSGSALLNLCVKSVLSGAGYVAVLALLDGCFRRALAEGWKSLRHWAEPSPVEIGKEIR